MAATVKNVEGMKRELKRFKYDNLSTHWLVHNDPNNDNLIQPTDDQIVALYNIHCIPKNKWDHRS